MTEKLNYVSLGDSIATGTLTPFSSIPTYVFYLRKRLYDKGYKTTVYNLARDGDTSRDLLWKINHAAGFRKIIEKADVITLSIGGNDLMRSASIPGFTSINVHMAEFGARDFIRNWPKIIDGIRTINKEAKMIVLNLYNPYNSTRSLGRDYYNDRNLCELTDRFLVQMNEAIDAYSENNYMIADVYARFKNFSNGNMYRVSCLYPSSLLRNPHPSPGAQKIMTDLIFDRIQA
ncbi:MAG: GDSL-type esterase/lipase family protein [Oscillospiraceae bacterium]|jgi:lysophospholipase L1-like esterase|nr:GDSL-type esterase/lipase family protein [Oscillospiraceae bacterium]